MEVVVQLAFSSAFPASQGRSSSPRAGVNTKRTAGKYLTLVFVPKYGILEVLKSSVRCKLILSFGIIPNLAIDFLFDKTD